jgi:hypothetical protein
MIRICGVMLFLLLSQASECLAGFNFKADGAGILAWSFVGFVALFVVSQMIPACVQCLDLIRKALSGHFVWKDR